MEHSIKQGMEDPRSQQLASRVLADVGAQAGRSVTGADLDRVAAQASTINVASEFATAFVDMLDQWLECGYLSAVDDPVRTLIVTVRTTAAITDRVARMVYDRVLEACKAHIELEYPGPDGETLRFEGMAIDAISQDIVDAVPHVLVGTGHVEPDAARAVLATIIMSDNSKRVMYDMRRVLAGTIMPVIEVERVTGGRINGNDWDGLMQMLTPAVVQSMKQQVEAPAKP